MQSTKIVAHIDAVNCLIYCEYCAEEVNHTDNPLFADDEWFGSYPICDRCGDEIDGLSLIFASPPTDISQTEIHTWFERDRSCVELRDKRTDETLLEFWDDEVQEEVEAGFLDPQNWHRSAWEIYTEHHHARHHRKAG